MMSVTDMSHLCFRRRTFTTRVRRGPDGSSLLRSDERPRELARVGRPEVVEGLADAHERDRQPELVCDRDRDPALGRAVELRQRDTGDPGRLVEQPCLLK